MQLDSSVSISFLGILFEPQSPLLVDVTSLSVPSPEVRNTGSVINACVVVASWNDPFYPLRVS
jgi:hypothetical protein